ELVDGADDERGQLAVHLLVDEYHRNAVGVVARAEGAGIAIAADGDPGRLLEVVERQVGGDELLSAPGAVFQGTGRWARPLPELSELRPDFRHGVAGGAATDPEAHGQPLAAELVRALAPKKLERAHQRRGASYQVEREKAQGIEKDHGTGEADAGAARADRSAQSGRPS